MTLNKRILLFTILTVIFIFSWFVPLFILIPMNILTIDGALLAGVRKFLGDGLMANTVANIIPLVGCSVIFFRTSKKSYGIITGFFMMVFTFSFITFNSSFNEDSEPFYLKPALISLTSGLILIVITVFVYAWKRKLK